MAFSALITIGLTNSLFVAINQATPASTLNGCNLWTSRGFYYRAIAVTNLRVIYYSKDHSNILNPQSLTEIHSIEQQIKSWTGYCNYSIVYKETDWDMKSLLDVSPLYLTGPPFSVINYMFPQSLSNYSLFNGDGATFYEAWLYFMYGANYLDDMIWFNPNEFDVSAPFTPFLVSYYPFSGPDEKYNSPAEFTEFVRSFDRLLDSITSQNIFISHSYPDVDALSTQTLSINGKIYRNQQENVSLCEYYFGYDIHTGDSSQEMQFIEDQERDRYIYFNSPIKPKTLDPDHELEECRRDMWPIYLADNNEDTIYYDNYRWNMQYDNNEYYCTVLVENVTFCNGQWQSVDDGQYADINAPPRTTGETPPRTSGTPPITVEDGCMHVYNSMMMLLWTTCLMISI
eukprot:445482_1